MTIDIIQTLEKILTLLDSIKEFDSLYLLELPINISDFVISPLITNPATLQKLYYDLNPYSTLVFNRISSECIIWNKKNKRFEIIGTYPDSSFKVDDIAWDRLLTGNDDFYIMANTYFSYNTITGDDRRDF